MIREGWIHKVACAHVPPDVFFPEDERSSRRMRVEQAQMVCRACPVRKECAQDALDRGAHHGVVAGVDLGSYGRSTEQRTARRRAELQAIADGLVAR